MRGTGFEPREDVLAALRASSLIQIRPVRYSSSLSFGQKMRGTGFEPDEDSLSLVFQGSNRPVR
jgi:hypothetical protein